MTGSNVPKAEPPGFTGYEVGKWLAGGHSRQEAITSVAKRNGVSRTQADDELRFAAWKRVC